MPVDPQRLQSVFLAALKASDRQAMLDRECAGDLELRSQVERLLAAHDDSQPLPAASDCTSDYPPISEKPGSMIGPYKLKEQIGEGGFGLVFVAEQTEPVKRKVALKVIKPGMDTREVMARFTAERQALALMDHPNIARVLDAGATDSGRPYFVMELVRGIPITDYCDQNQLSPRERLDLFITVCQAVQHAHQKGIIHRDIKPSNVLVTSHDGKPVAKVIDFGVAKAINQQLTDRSIYTNFAQMIGTPLYMSPEQAEMSGLDIDTRSDIYSLGVLLYELLTGTTPIDKKRFAKAAYDEIRRMIREDEPQKPSTRLSTSDSIASVAAQRHTEPAKLSKLMRGDLDWITMKALEKDRTRRYETANGLALDVQRYLADEPVVAGPPSANYRMKKFVKRNKVVVTTVGLLAASLIVGIAAITYGWIQATKAQYAEAQRADAERQARIEITEEKERVAQAQSLAEGRLQQTKQEKMRADEEAAITNAVNDFLLKDLLRQADPSAQADLRYSPEPDVKVRTLLYRVETTIANRFADRPLVEAAIRKTVGDVFNAIGEPTRARTHISRCLELRNQKLGPDHPQTLAAMNSMTSAILFSGEIAKSIPMLEQLRHRRSEVLGKLHPDTLDTENNLAEAYLWNKQRAKAIELFKQVLAARESVLGEQHRDTLETMNRLASAYLTISNTKDAIPLLQKLVAAQANSIGVEHPNAIQSGITLACALQTANDLPAATDLFIDWIPRANKHCGPDDHLTRIGLVMGQFVVRDIASNAELWPKAKQLNALILEILRASKKHGPESTMTIDAMNSLAMLERRTKNLDKSIALFVEAVAISEKTLGRQNPKTLLSIANLGISYRDAGDVERSIPLLAEAFAASEQHQSLGWVGHELVTAYLKKGDARSALNLTKALIAISRDRFPEPSIGLAREFATIGKSLIDLKAWVDAESVLRECLSIRETKEPRDWRTFNTQSMLGSAMLGQKKYAEAEPFLLQGYEGMKQHEAKIPKSGGGELRIPEALDRLIELYTAINKPDEVKKWQAERAKYPEAKTEPLKK